MAKTIRVTTEEKIPTFELSLLESLQGDLKTLDETNFAKLRKSVEKHGFFVPMFIWNNGKTLKLIDGHQRVRLMTYLRDQEGYAIPRLPAIPILAKSEKDAKEKLLLVTSAFGKVEKDGLYEFLQGLDAENIIGDITLPGIDSLKFLEEFYLEAPTEPLPAVPGNLSSVGGNGVKHLDIVYTEAELQEVLQMIGVLRDAYGTANASETVKRALSEALARLG